MSGPNLKTWFRKSINDELLRSFDIFSHSITVIGEKHRMIHDGFFFNATGVVAAVANNASADILLTFPAGHFGHLTLVEFTIDDGPATALFYENVVTSADGTAVNVRNHNRVNGNDASNAVVTLGPTITDIGDELDIRHIPGGGPPGQNAGQLVAGEDAEWLLGSPTVETKYMWRLTNQSGGAITIGFHFNGYEPGYPEDATALDTPLQS